MFSFLRRRRPKQTFDLVVNSTKDVLPYFYWTESQPVRFHLPPAMLCTQPALQYAEDHPFVQALDVGPTALHRFYSEFQPADLADAYRLNRKGRLGEDLPPWEMPWMMRTDRRPPGGEAGLDASHGFALYGPATEQKAALEMSRLRSVASSIARRGYDMRSGGIQGQFLAKGDQLRFFVKVGKHRTAALVHSGRSHIPVSIRPTWTPVVDADDVHRWPLVLAGMIDPSVAEEVLSAYMPDKDTRIPPPASPSISASSA